MEEKRGTRRSEPGTRNELQTDECLWESGKTFRRPMKSTTLGGCFCGQFRYQLKSDPINVTNCHCIDCRRASAAPIVTWGSVQAKDFEVVTGELKRVTFADRLRAFAACCHTPILFQESEGSEWLDVTVVSLDNPEVYLPSGETWTEDKLP